MYLIETIIYLVLVSMRSLNEIFSGTFNNQILNILMIIALVLGLIPILITIIKKGIGSLTIGYNISRTNLIGWICNLVLYILVLIGIPYVIYALFIINAIIFSIDVIKMLTGREILK